MIKLDFPDPFEEINAPVSEGSPYQTEKAFTPKIKLDFPDPFEVTPATIPQIPTEPSRWSVLTPVAPQPSAPLPERGWLGDLATATGRGLVDIGQMAGRGIRTLSPFESAYKPEGIGTQIIEATEKLSQSEALKPSPEAAGGSTLRTAAAGTLQSMGPSMAAGIPGAILGAKVGTLFGPGYGTALGGLIGFAAGAIPAFFMSEYDRFMQEGKAAGLKEEDVKPLAIASGMVEGGFEGAADIIAGRFLGLTGKTLTQPLKNTIREALKIPLGTMAKGALKQMPVEITTEMIQNASELALRQKAGIPVEGTPWEAAKEAIGPSIGMTLLYAIGAKGIHGMQRRGIYNSLTNPQTPIQDRLNAVEYVKSGLEQEAKANVKTDPEAFRQFRELANQWDTLAKVEVNNGLSINIDRTLEEHQASFEPGPQMEYMGFGQQEEMEGGLPFIGEEDRSTQWQETWKTGGERPFAFDPKSTKTDGWWTLAPRDLYEKVSNYQTDNKLSAKKMAGMGLPVEPGIQYVIGTTKDGKKEVQAVRFKKKSFTEEQAAEWWRRNADKFGRGKPVAETGTVVPETITPVPVTPPGEKAPKPPTLQTGAGVSEGIPSINRDQAIEALGILGEVKKRGNATYVKTDNLEHIDSVDLSGGVWRRGESKHDLDITISAKKPLSPALIAEAEGILAKVQEKSPIRVDVIFVDVEGNPRHGIPEWERKEPPPVKESLGEGKQPSPEGEPQFKLSPTEEPGKDIPKIVNAKTLTKEIQSEPDYVYHATNEERLSEIVDTGKLRTHRPHEFTDQDVWPDGSTQKRAYFSNQANIVWQFAPEEGRPVVIRTKGQELQKESTGDIYSIKPVSIDKLEYLGEDNNWYPVSNLKSHEGKGEPQFKLAPTDWSKDSALVEDAKFVAQKAGVKPSDLEYVGVQSFKPLSNEAMHLWNVMDPKSPRYQSTISGKSFQMTPEEETRYKVASQTETPAFKEWFGDSKVVHKNGKPLVVYHGTEAKKLTEFKPEKIGALTGVESQAFWFSDKKHAAGWFGPYVKSVFLKMDNPLVVTNEQFSETQNGPSYWSKKALADGHDGVIIKNIIDGDTQSTVYAVFEPTQIKSATLNIGTFDKEDPDIRYKKGVGIQGEPLTVEQLTQHAEKIISFMAPGSKVRFHDTLQIDLNDPNVKEALRKQGIPEDQIKNGLFTIEGRHVPIYLTPTRFYSIVDIALNAPNVKQVIGHEGGHGIYKLLEIMGKEQELTLLNEHFKNDQEAISDAFAKYYLAQEGLGKKSPLPKMVRTVFDKVIDFFRKVKNYVKGLGFTSAEEIFGKGMVGEYRAQYEAREKKIEGLRKQVAPLVSDWTEGRTVEGESEQLKGMARETSLQVGPVYHGSPYKFDKFTNEAIGTGEGAQAFGYGHYVTESPEVAQAYAKKLGYPAGTSSADMAGRVMEATGGNKESALKELLSRKKLSPNIPDFSKQVDEAIKHIQGDTYTRPNLYQATIHKGKRPGEYTFLEWEKPLTQEFRDKIIQQASKEGVNLQGGEAVTESDGMAVFAKGIDDIKTVGGLYDYLTNRVGGYTPAGKKETSAFLQRAGISGIKYPVGSLSGMKETGKYNYVVFNPEDITIEKIGDKPIEEVFKKYSSDPEQFKLSKAEESEIHSLDSPFSGLSQFKIRFNTGIKEKDLGKIERTTSLPFWIGQKFPAFKKIFDREWNRRGDREEMAHDFFKQVEPFTNLSRGSSDRVLKVLQTGDADAKVYTEQELRSIHHLNNAEAKGYLATRSALDNALSKMLAQAEEMTLKPYEGKPFYQEMQSLINAPSKERAGEWKTAEANLTPKDFKELQLAWTALKEAPNTIRELRQEFGRQKGYFPRERGRGEYVIRVRDTEGTVVWSERTDDLLKIRQKMQANDIKDRLERKYQPKGYSVELKPEKAIPETIYGEISDVSIQRFMDKALQKVEARGEITGEDAETLRDSLLEVLSDQLKVRGFGERMVGRIRNEKGDVIGGYKTENGKELIANYINGMAGFLTKQKAAYDFMQLLKEIPITGETAQTELYDYAKTYIRDMLRNSTTADRLSSWGSSMMFGWYITGRVAAGAINATQSFTTTIPGISRESGKNPEAIVAKAGKDVAFSRLSKEEKAMLDHLISRGDTSAKYVKEQIGVITNSPIGNFYQKALEILSLPFSAVEIFNRKTAALSMYRVARREQGLSHEEATQKAQDFILQTQFAYGKANAPELMRSGGTIGGVARAFYTFRSFNHNFIIGLVKALGTDAEGKRHIAVFGRSLAYVALFGGLTALPFIDDLLDQLEKVTGVPFRTKMRKSLKGTGGEILEKFGMTGLPALIGYDLSGSLRIGLPKASLKGMEENIYGVYGGMITKADNAIAALSRGDYLRAIESAAPLGLENVMKARRMATEGMTTPRGKLIYDEQGKPVTLTTGEAIGQTLGFRPERTSSLAQEKRVESNVDLHYRDKRDSLYSRYRMAKTVEDRQKILKEVQRYNVEVMKYKGAIPRITAESLRKSFVPKQKTSERRWFNALQE